MLYPTPGCGLEGLATQYGGMILNCTLIMVLLDMVEPVLTASIVRRANLKHSIYLGPSSRADSSMHLLVKVAGSVCHTSASGSYACTRLLKGTTIHPEQTLAPNS